MTDRDTWTVDAMEKYGGGFVKQLAILARHADTINLRRIKEGWPEFWAMYEKQGIELEKQSA